MEEQKGGKGGGGGGSGESARVSSSSVEVGQRQRFAVELRPDETTIVSWKKLVKDAGKVDRPTLVAQPLPNAHPALESRLAPPAENEVEDPPPGSRFSAVIEKIERLYMGKHSSDEEDLNNVPDDDEYDTEDSFIDDVELDEYFQVDDSAIKHDGFFVNRGKLERMNEPTLLPNLQPKKRGRKDSTKADGDGIDTHVPNKHVKLGKNAAGKSALLVGKNNAGPSHIVAVSSIHSEHMKFQNQMNSSEIYAGKQPAEAKNSTEPSPLKVSNLDAASPIQEERVAENQQTRLAPSKYQGNKLKDGVEIPDALVQRSDSENFDSQCNSQSGKISSSVAESDHTVQQKKRDGVYERPGLNYLKGKHSVQTMRKEGSGVRLKSTMLEKAIEELEKMVEESRRLSMDVQDADNSIQAVKRRLPHEVKQKLAKVARIAQASHGKISKELVNRLMTILGHMIQLRSLKRNLNIMVNMGLSAKKEKDDKFLQMKKETAELIRMRMPDIQCKEVSNEEKEVIRKKYCMDDLLEDKICDLYDVYVEGLDEDAGPHARKLYSELAELWPDGFMDNHGIKRAIFRARDRKKFRYSQHKVRDKIKRKKMIPRTEEGIQLETSSIAQPQHLQEKVVADSSNHGLTSLSRPVPNATAANPTMWMPSSIMNGPNLDRPRQEKNVKASSSNPNDGRTMDVLPKKKVKRKPEMDSDIFQFRPEKLTSVQGEERHKSHKQVVLPPQKPSLPLVSAAPQKTSLPWAPTASNFEQPS